MDDGFYIGDVKEVEKVWKKSLYEVPSTACYLTINPKS